MRKILIAILMLAGAALGCNLGASPVVPTIPPTIAFLPTSTPFYVVASPTSFIQVQPGATNTNIPGYSTLPPIGSICSLPPAGWVRYVIQSGDTLSGIAVATNSTVDALAAANCISDVNLLSIGQALYVPRYPVVIRPTATNGGIVPSTIQLFADPSTFVNGQYVVSPGRVLIRAGNIRAGTRIWFYYQVPGQTQAFLGEGQVLNGAAQYAFTASSIPANNVWYMTAVAKDVPGNIVQYSQQITVSRSDAPPIFPTLTPTASSGEPVIGTLSISPAEAVYAPGLRYRLVPPTLTLSLTSVQNVVQVRFLVFPAANAEPYVLATINNPPSGIPIQTTYAIDCTKTNGQLVAQAIGTANRTALSNILDVYCGP